MATIIVPPISPLDAVFSVVVHAATSAILNREARNVRMREAGEE